MCQIFNSPAPNQIRRREWKEHLLSMYNLLYVGFHACDFGWWETGRESKQSVTTSTRRIKIMRGWKEI